MSSIRKAERRFSRWMRYFRKYEPWHMATPGLERAYNALIHAETASQRRGWAELQRRSRDAY